MSITIKLSNGTQKSVEVPDLGINVAQFKEIAFASTGIPADEQRVIVRGRVLKNEDVLSSIGLEHGQAVHIVRGQKSSNMTSDTPSQSTPSAQGASSAPSSTSAHAGTVPVNPYMALSGGLYPPSSNAANPGNINPFSQGMGGGWPMPSQESMLQMMQNPIFNQLLQETMRNPQLMQQIMQMTMSNQGANPDMGMSGMQGSPALMQQSMQLMNNPHFMQQMLRMMGNNSDSPFLGQPTSQQGPSVAPSAQQFTPNVMNFLQPQGDPRTIYYTQLQQLRDMGFPNEDANIAALEQSQGNMDFAIDRLLNV